MATGLRRISRKPVSKAFATGWQCTTVRDCRLMKTTTLGLWTLRLIRDLIIHLLSEVAVVDRGCLLHHFNY